jgi:hypothetical protein
MPNFNVVYLHNYELLDYGLIYKNIPKWGLDSVVLGPGAHFICLSFCFHVIQTCSQNMACIGSFLCQDMCCA